MRRIEGWEEGVRVGLNRGVFERVEGLMGELCEIRGGEGKGGGRGQENRVPPKLAMPTPCELRRRGSKVTSPRP